MCSLHIAEFIFLLFRGSQRESFLKSSLNIPHEGNPDLGNGFSKTSHPAAGNEHQNQQRGSEDAPHARPVVGSAEDLSPGEPELGPRGVDATALNSAIGEREEGEGQEEVDGSRIRSRVDGHGNLAAAAGKTRTAVEDTTRSVVSRHDSSATLINEDMSQQFGNR